MRFQYPFSVQRSAFISSFCMIAGEFHLSNGSIEVDRKDSMQTEYEYLMTFFFYISGFMILPQRIPWFFSSIWCIYYEKAIPLSTHTHTHTYILHISSFDRIITFLRWFFIQYSTLLSLTVQKLWFFLSFISSAIMNISRMCTYVCQGIKE